MEVVGDVADLLSYAYLNKEDNEAIEGYFELFNEFIRFHPAEDFGMEDPEFPFLRIEQGTFEVKEHSRGILDWKVECEGESLDWQEDFSGDNDYEMLADRLDFLQRVSKVGELKEGTFCLINLDDEDGNSFYFDGYYNTVDFDRETGIDWVSPYFTFEQVKEIAVAITRSYDSISLKYIKEKDTFVYSVGGSEVASWQGKEIDEKKVYQIGGSSWSWIEKVGGKEESKNKQAS